MNAVREKEQQRTYVATLSEKELPEMVALALFEATQIAPPTPDESLTSFEMNSHSSITQAVLAPQLMAPRLCCRGV